MEVEVKPITEYKENEYHEVQRLLQELSNKEIKLSVTKYEEVIHQERAILFGCYQENILIGMATLTWYYCLSGNKGWIEDVVIRKEYRGKGLSKSLVNELIIAAKGKGIEAVLLTSKPSRIAANHLYQSLTFKKRETNVYKLNLVD